MHEPGSTTHPPRRILLATDLGARCDRALDRAVQLARQWQAPLLVVHALARDSTEPWLGDDLPPDMDRVQATRQRIERDLRDGVAELDIQVQEGTPGEVILAAAAREGCDLIVVGEGRDTLRQVVLGSTVEYLVRRSPVSVLIVKLRPRGTYRHILVGTDFTAESRDGLHVAAALFPQAEFTLLHALDIPYKSLWLDPQHREDFSRMERATIEAFVAHSELPDAVKQQLQLLVAHGHPEAMLRRHVRQHDAELCVIGAFRRGITFHMLIGGNARRIVRGVPSDILVVRAPATPTADQAGEPTSA
jgi:nucleotide-binding universal stress UspA family protein